MKAVIFDFNRTLYDPDTDSFIHGALKSLKDLKAHKFLLFLIGKGTNERANFINELGLQHYFDEIIVKEEKEIEDFHYLKNKYPDVDFYVFGDRVKKEIRFGNACGFKTIWFKKGKFASEFPDEEAERPWKIIEDYAGLEKVLTI